MKTLLRFFFSLLYHQFAFTYDLVAASVSFNRWKNWITSVVPFLEGTRILEIGHGPGHLQRILRSRGLSVVGIDESAQMGRLAKRKLKGFATTDSSLSPKNAYTQTDLVRGMAQHLPFPNESFDTVVATFPTEYIYDSRTLAEVMRCLCPGSRLVVLPAALPKNRFLEWLFKITNQSPTEALDIVESRLKEPFVTAGFSTEVKTLEVNSGTLLIVMATKSL